MSKVIIVTGSSRGIGAATARLAGEQGYAVCVNYFKNPEAAENVVSSIKAGGGQAIAVAGDMSIESDVVRLFTTVDKELGTVNALVNNAGIIALQSRVQDLDVARMQRLFAVNIMGYFLCAREAIKRMSTRMGGDGGAIVNVSSAAARLGSPGEFVDYAASKGAIDTMTIGLAREIADEGIRVNAVRPGLIDTEMHADAGDPNRAEKLRDLVPMKRVGTGEDIAKAVLWLLSDGASYSTGTIIDVSGGR
jgi:NAD(P)-dependent dehydrogenase (short-subunit alcohol dehydrogenase family)